MSEVHGECDEGFLPLRDLFQENLDAGEELGASLAVVRNGMFLVDLWGGWADTERSTRWVGDTITTTWSVTIVLGVVARSAARLPSAMACRTLCWSRIYPTVAAVSGSDGEGPSS